MNPSTTKKGEEKADTDDSALLESLKTRCDRAQMKYELSSDPQSPWIRIYFPAGRDTRALYIANRQHALRILATEFERISYVGTYDAICNYQQNFIHAIIGQLGTGPSLLRLRELFGIRFRTDVKPDRTYSIAIAPPSDHPNLVIELLLNSDEVVPFISGYFGPTRPSLVIRNLEFSTNQRALDLLETIANALFFEIDLRYNIPLMLLRQRPRLVAGNSHSSRRAISREHPLSFPTTSYDRVALELYWYGRSAAGMPLLRFLAFYQSIEFYFPTYSQKEAIRQVKNMLKDPRFNVHDDNDIAKVVNAFQVTRNGNFGDERSQFRSVIINCVDAAALRSFLEHEYLRDFYADQKQWKSLSKTKIPVNEPETDLRSAVADRLYDIRCRIVHAKSDGGSVRTEALLPFSREAEQLIYDTTVIQFISTQTLIASSTRLAL